MGAAARATPAGCLHGPERDCGNALQQARQPDVYSDGLQVHLSNRVIVARGSVATLDASPGGPLGGSLSRDETDRRTGSWLGAAIGFIAGTVAGLVLAVAFHQHAYAFWGFVLGGTIFGRSSGGS